MEKKIRVTIPYHIFDIITGDATEFGITKNFLCNYIFEKMKNLKFADTEHIYSGDKETIQFNLNNKNKSDYYEFLLERGIQVEAEFFRKIFCHYGSLSKRKRELFIFQELLEKLQHGIKNQRIIKITFRDGKYSKVTPYSLGHSKLEIANYVFCYDMAEKKYKNYSLKNIKDIYIYRETGFSGDRDYIEKMKKEFDPFLSHGQRVKIRLSTKGERILKELATNRPILLSKEGNKFEFECSEEKAKRYFSYFLDEAEILEPIHLREWFKKRHQNALQNYK
jgi:predicted DNA-binding transcriptional regulator YafY